MEKKIRKRIVQAIKERVFPGCVVGFVKGKKTEFVAAGRYTYDLGSPRVDKDTVYDVASITKVIPTSCLALILIDCGQLRLEDKVVKFIPQLQTSCRDQVTIRHLLTQTLSFPFSLSSLRDKKPQQILNHIFTAKFDKKPGDKFSYTNATSILLGMVIEKVTGARLDGVAHTDLFGPLQMIHSTFSPKNPSSIPPTEVYAKGIDIQGVVHDESARVLSRIMVPGSAGLFTTAEDLLHVIQMLLHSGRFNNKQIVSEQMIMQMQTNQISNLDLSTGLGWELFQPRYMGKFAAKERFGKTGFTGCMLLCDRGKQVGVVMLSNATYPKRKKNTNAINLVRRDIADIILAD